VLRSVRSDIECVSTTLLGDTNLGTHLFIFFSTSFVIVLDTIILVFGILLSSQY
jgi:hypothetical protein